MDRKINLNESKSVSDEVVRISEEIVAKITEDSENRKGFVGSVTNLVHKSGRFTYSTNSVIGDMTVEYTLFYFSGIAHYRYYEASGIFNCACDSDSNRIEVSGAVIGGVIEESFVTSIAHEVNHLYQYRKGFKRNDGLYGTIVDIAVDYNCDIQARVPSLLVYFTFGHEVDSFAVQFYQMLKHGTGDYKQGFESALLLFEPYTDIMWCVSYYKAHKNEDKVKEGIRLTGLTPKQWKIRVHFGLKRLRQKLYNAYCRYESETVLFKESADAKIGRSMRNFRNNGTTGIKLEPIFRFE